MNRYPQTNVHSQNTSYRTPYSVRLFAKEVEFNRLLAAVKEQHRSLGMLSVGCSIGAEIDSALAAAQTIGFETVHAFGIDKNRDALEAAKQGTYQTVFPRPPGFRHMQSRALKAAGFEVTAELHGLNISATALRQQAKEVSFARADIPKDPMPFDRFNFIMCHNVLCCIRGENGLADINTAMDTLANSLQPGGVLSLAAEASALRPEHDKAPSSYLATHQHAAQFLIEQGMRPIAFSPQQVPVAFQQPPGS